MLKDCFKETIKLNRQRLTKIKLWLEGEGGWSRVRGRWV